MTPRYEQVLELVRKTQPATRKGLAETVGVKPATMSVYLNGLRVLGLARTSGRGCKATWSVVGSNQAASSVFALGAAMGGGS